MTEESKIDLKTLKFISFWRNFVYGKIYRMKKLEKCDKGRPGICFLRAGIENSERLYSELVLYSYFSALFDFSSTLILFPFIIEESTSECILDYFNRSRRKNRKKNGILFFYFILSYVKANCEQNLKFAIQITFAFICISI